MSSHAAHLKVHASHDEGLRLGMPRDSLRHKALLLPLPQPKQALLRPATWRAPVWSTAITPLRRRDEDLVAHMQHTRQLNLCTGEVELPDITRHAGTICKAADRSWSALRCTCSACFLCSTPPCSAWESAPCNTLHQGPVRCAPCEDGLVALALDVCVQR